MDSKTKAVIYNISPSYTINEIWQLSAGLDGMADKKNDMRIGWHFNSTVLLGKYFSIDMRLEQNNYTDNKNSQNDYNEFIFQTTLSARW